jgi:hypothetical protein
VQNRRPVNNLNRCRAPSISSLLRGPRLSSTARWRSSRPVRHTLSQRRS